MLVAGLLSLALAGAGLGCKEESLKLDLHYVNPKPILEKKGLIQP